MSSGAGIKRPESWPIKTGIKQREPLRAALALSLLFILPENGLGNPVGQDLFLSGFRRTFGYPAFTGQDFGSICGFSGCIQGPVKVIVVDHLPGHPSVDADVFPGDKSGLVGAEKEDHVGNSFVR